MFGILAVLFLVLLNGFFVATEFAIVAVRRSRLEQRAAEGSPAALAARDVVRHLDSYIAACQFGITLASLGLGWIGEPAFAHLIEPPLIALVGSFAPALAHGVAIGIAFAIITALHIVIGELAPKGLALQRAEATALWVARPMQIFYRVFRLPITLLNTVGNGMLRLGGLHPASGHEMAHSVEELRYLVTGMERAGEVEVSEAKIATRALEFADLTAGALMTPRTELEAVPVNLPLEELVGRIASGVHTRLLVYDQSLDDVVGVLRVRDIFPALGQPQDSFVLRSLVRPVLSVPESEHADHLLEDMRRTRNQIAVVVDEYGGTAGIVTLEDIAEALVGPIEEEGALPLAAADTEFSGPRPQADGSTLIPGLTRIHELEEIVGRPLDDETHEGVDTLGGLVMAQLERVPHVGDEIDIAGRALRVEALDGYRVAEVRLLPDASREDQGIASA